MYSEISAFSWVIKQNLSYTPRMQHYKTDGTGRDQYIVYNSGGNSVIIFKNKIINI